MEKIDELKKGDKVKLNFLGLDICNLTKVDVKDGDICTFIEIDGSYMELSLNGVRFKMEIYPDYHWEKVEKPQKIVLPDVLYLKIREVEKRVDERMPDFKHIKETVKIKKLILRDEHYCEFNSDGEVIKTYKIRGLSALLEDGYSNHQYATEAEYIAQDTRKRVPIDNITMDNINRVAGVELKPKVDEQVFLKQGKVYDIFFNNMELCFICELGEVTKPSEFSNILNAVLEEEG